MTITTITVQERRTGKGVILQGRRSPLSGQHLSLEPTGMYIIFFFFPNLLIFFLQRSHASIENGWRRGCNRMIEWEVLNNWPSSRTAVNLVNCLNWIFLICQWSSNFIILGCTWNYVDCLKASISSHPLQIVRELGQLIFLRSLIWSSSLDSNWVRELGKLVKTSHLIIWSHPSLVRELGHLFEYSSSEHPIPLYPYPGRTSTWSTVWITLHLIILHHPFHLSPGRPWTWVNDLKTSHLIIPSRTWTW